MPSQPTQSVKAIVAANIKAGRRRKGLKLRELGDRVGATEAQMWRWEAGKHLPLDDTLKAIASALEMEFVDLLSEPPEDVAA